MSIIDALVQKAFSQQQQSVFKDRPPIVNATAPKSTGGRQQSVKQSSHSQQSQTSIVVINDAYGKQTFYDPRNAALFTLLSTGVSLVDFLNWAATERATMLASSCSATTDASSWKFLLLQDNSLAGFVMAEPPHLSSTSTSSTLPTYSSSNCSHSSSDKPDHKLELPATMIPTAIGIERSLGVNCAVQKDRQQRQYNSCEQKLVMPKGSKSTKRKTDDLSISASPMAPSSEDIGTGGGGCGRGSKKKRVATGADGSSVKTRGSARRIPKLEGVTECPDCKKKGQSIFDPNNWNSDGMVWQYFYCRNQDCPRGKSTNRYIGWTLRVRDSNK